MWNWIIICLVVCRSVSQSYFSLLQSVHNYLPSSLSVCPVYTAPLVLLLQETPAFRPQSRHVGARVRRQVKVTVGVAYMKLQYGCVEKKMQ